jgi:hypothetical protein
MINHKILEIKLLKYQLKILDYLVKFIMYNLIIFELNMKWHLNL